jgi:hypothetical protein
VGDQGGIKDVIGHHRHPNRGVDRHGYQQKAAEDPFGAAIRGALGARSKPE